MDSTIFFIWKRNWALFVTLFLTLSTQAQTVMKVMVDQPQKLEIVESSFFSLTSSTIKLGDNIKIQGGVTPYRYSWLKDGQVIGSSLKAEVPKQTPAMSSTFTLIVNDAKNCNITIKDIYINVIDVTAGGLKNLLGDKISTTKNLILTGTIDARDFKTMRDDMPLLTEIDLSGSKIVAYSGSLGTSFSDFGDYPADAVPERAFQNKTNLASVILPSFVTSTSNYAFAFCSGLTLVSLPEGLISIVSGSFHECAQITSFNIPSTVSSIGSGAFYNSGGTFIVHAGNQNFSSEDGVLFDKNKTTLIQCPVSKTGRYIIPSTVTTISAGSFQNVAGITGTLTIPSSVTRIEYAAFINCSGLSTIIIPSSVTSIGNGAFSGCTNLTAITAKSIVPINLSSSWDVFYNINKTTCVLYVPVGTINAYKASDQWKDFINILEIPEFKLSSATATIGATGGTVSTGITTGLAWTATSNQNWLGVSPVSGTGNQTFTLTIEGNSGSSIRTATVTFSASGVGPLTFIVSQDGVFTTQLVSFNTGWNIFSATIIPSNPDLKVLFQSLIDAGKLKKVMDESGKAIENFGAFGGWKNNIGNLLSTEGYKVNALSAGTLTLEGTPVALPLDIPLGAGWNIISYPVGTAQDALALFQPLIDAGKLKKVMDETGKSIENFGAFGGWKNNIGNLVTGKGYKVNVTAAGTLTISASTNKSAVMVPELLPSYHFAKVYQGNGTDHFNVHLVNLASSGLRAGDEIGIFDEKSCVGSATIGQDQLISGILSIPASWNDELTGVVNGFTTGHPVTLQLYRDNHSYPLSPEKISGSEAFEKNGSLFLQVKASDLPVVKIITPEDQVKCYPNPFSDQLTIVINLTEPKKLEVKIYDLSGRLVRSLFKGDAGTSITLLWDGKSGSGAKTIPGTYLLKANEITEKIVLNK